MKPCKKILFIINSSLDNSGVPKVAFDIISGLHEKYYFDILVQSDKIGYYDEILKSLGCNIIYYGKPFVGKKLYIYNLTCRILKLRKTIKRGRYDVIQSFTGYQAGIDCLAGALAGSKIRIANIHGTVKRNHTLFTGTYERICLYLIGRFSTVRIGVSEQAALSIYSGVSYKVIYNSIPFDEFLNIKKTEHSEINLIQIGYYNENKNQLFSLKILNELKLQGRNVRLFFIGYAVGDNYFQKMQNYIHQYNLSDCVSFLEHDYDKKKVFPIIDYMLQPSLSEGLSLTALECQASKIPCIVSEAIPQAADIGLLHRLPLYDADAWGRFICDNLGSNDTLDERKCLQFSRDRFLSNFDSIYSNGDIR